MGIRLPNYIIPTVPISIFRTFYSKIKITEIYPIMFRRTGTSHLRGAVVLNNHFITLSSTVPNY